MKLFSLTFVVVCSSEVFAGNRVDEAACPEIVRRKSWGALPPQSKINARPAGNVIIHHSPGPNCVTETTCSSIMKTTQLQHMQTKGWDDIGYNFLVAENGQVYEGRGWGIEAAGAMGLTKRALHIGVIGSFNHRAPSDLALKAIKDTLLCGIDLGKLRADYTLSGHRDIDPTVCPGHKLYAIIKEWPRYVKRPAHP